MDKCDVIVIGAGHAGIEAALACARMGRRALMLTLRRDSIGLMSCNPAIGGVGKAQLVREIDALGGVMARATDACGIQFRILNASKGAAVQSSRAQVDSKMYNQYMLRQARAQENLFIKEAEASKLIMEGGRVCGVLTAQGEEIIASCVIISTGTFLEGLIHVGLKHFPGGRIDEPAAGPLAQNLKDSGFTLMRFKTGTCPRLDKNSVDFSKLTVQNGDQPPLPFSFSTQKLAQKQIPCHITYTNTRTHKIIKDNLKYSPLYTGLIKATGVRYCPSIEDKIVKFSDKERHQVFLEPQGYDSQELYPNGLSTSLPEEAQLQILHSIEGLQEAKVIKFGYGIEHSVIDARQLYPTLESKPVKNLYFAGQINGTTGYEEAAAQGLIAGINASLKIVGKDPLVLGRDSSYIGVLIDDLTTKGTNEPYRMFTSRVEYRLILRQDNADLRLASIGYGAGLVSKEDYHRASEKAREIGKGISLLKVTQVNPTPEINAGLARLGAAPIKKKVSLEEILKRPQVDFGDLKNLDHLDLDIPEYAGKQVEIEIKYSGFIRRQMAEVEKFRNLEKIKLSRELDYSVVRGLSREIREKLSWFKPMNLGQASRISGVTPAAISVLMVYLKKGDAPNRS